MTLQAEVDSLREQVEVWMNKVRVPVHSRKRRCAIMQEKDDEDQEWVYCPDGEWVYCPDGPGTDDRAAQVWAEEAHTLKNRNMEVRCCLR